MPQKRGIQRGVTNFRAIRANEPNGSGGSRRRCKREPWLWRAFLRHECRAPLAPAASLRLRGERR